MRVPEENTASDSRGTPIEDLVTGGGAPNGQADDSLRAVIEGMTDGILLVDERGIVRFANPAAEKMFGYEKGSLTGCYLGYPIVEGMAEIEIPVSGGGLSVAEIRTVKIRWKGEPVYLAGFRDITARKQAEDEVVSLSRELLHVHESLQRRIGGELHDAVGQSLIGLKLAFHQVKQRFLEHFPNEKDPARKEVEKIGAIVDDIIGTVRSLSHNLKPAVLEDNSLRETLLNHFDHLNGQTGLSIRFSQSGLERRYAREVETTVFRIVQEALINAARHSGVNEVEVDVRKDDGSLVVTVADRVRLGGGREDQRKNG